jgi:hypothetical protein
LFGYRRAEGRGRVENAIRHDSGFGFRARKRRGSLVVRSLSEPRAPEFFERGFQGAGENRLSTKIDESREGFGTHRLCGGFRNRARFCQATELVLLSAAAWARCVPADRAHGSRSPRLRRKNPTGPVEAGTSSDAASRGASYAGRGDLRALEITGAVVRGTVDGANRTAPLRTTIVSAWTEKFLVRGAHKDRGGVRVPQPTEVFGLTISAERRLMRWTLGPPGYADFRHI